MEMAGHECVGHVEWDKFAQKSYMAMHDVKESEFIGWDITKIRADELPRADVWCFGFPCQDISIAGQQTGFRGHCSSLFFTVTKLIRELEEESKPSILFIENVKNLLSINRGGDFLKLLIELDEIGYDAEWQVLNSKNFGVPQNRERLFVVGHLRGRGGRKIFPITEGNEVYNRTNETEKEVHEIALCLTARGQSNWTGSFINVVGNLDRPQYHESSNRIYGVDGIAPSQNTQQGGGHETKIKHNDRIRRLTPRECFRLQGFPDKYFDKAKAVGMSDTQLWKQAGNSVTVNVIYEIARRF